MRVTTLAPMIPTDRKLRELWIHLDALELSDKPPYPFYIERYVRNLFHIADCYEVKTVLEIGIGSIAMSAQAFAQSMSNRGGGKLVSIDIDNRRPNDVQKDFVLSKDVEWTRVYGSSYAPGTIVPELEYDLLYIDGDHSGDAPRLDFEKFYPLVKPGGIVLFDDYQPGDDDPHGSNLGVRTLINSLTKQGFNLFPILIDPPQGNHCVIHQKPKG